MEMVGSEKSFQAPRIKGAPVAVALVLHTTGIGLTLATADFLKRSGESPDAWQTYPVKLTYWNLYGSTALLLRDLQLALTSSSNPNRVLPLLNRLCVGANLLVVGMYWGTIFPKRHPTSSLAWTDTLIVHGGAAATFVMNYVLQNRIFRPVFNVTCFNRNHDVKEKKIGQSLVTVSMPDPAPTWVKGIINRNELLGMLAFFGSYVLATVVFNKVTGNTPYVNKLDYTHEPGKAAKLIGVAMLVYLMLTQLFSAMRSLDCCRKIGNNKFVLLADTQSPTIKSKESVDNKKIQLSLP